MAVDKIDIEEHASNGARKPEARSYAFRVNKIRLEVSDALLTGQKVLELARLIPPANYILRQVIHGGGLKIVELNDQVDLRAPGLERFRAMLRTAQDG